MSAKILHTGQLSQRERSVLMLIRSGRASDDAAMAAAFSALAQDAARAGLVVSAPANPIVHCDEKKLLAWLTLFQRQKAEPRDGWDADLDARLMRSLRDCALLLDRAALRLDYRNAVRFLAGARARHEWRDAACERASAGPCAADARPLPQSSLHRRVLGLVAEKGTIATHDLNAAGASNHDIGTMRKRGILRRVRHGVYALARPDRGPPAGSVYAGHAPGG